MREQRTRHGRISSLHEVETTFKLLTRQRWKFSSPSHQESEWEHVNAIQTSHPSPSRRCRQRNLVLLSICSREDTSYPILASLVVSGMLRFVEMRIGRRLTTFALGKERETSGYRGTKRGDRSTVELKSLRA
jgi:hypothetical protein